MGWATVYLAHDERHNRNVALKVLKAELAAVVGAERFLAEIETTAKLTHPHVLPLFDSGEADGFLYYVMPYVEGESLRERLDRDHQLPVDEAVGIATDLAEALDYAHRQGVLHRDIKPGNVLIHDGQPVITDFGIALAVGGAGGSRLTETGLSVGTPHYMSPEQATGSQHLGPATDIYALGCVLYETLVGEPPYTGSTAQAILGRIIAGERVSVSAQRETVPPNVDAVVGKALEKLPADRFSSAARFAQALRDPSFTTFETTPAAMSAFRAQGLGVVALGVALVAIGLALWGWMRPLPPQPVSRTQISLPEDQRVFGGRLGHPLAISRDGTRLVYVGERAGVRGLFLRELNDLTPRMLDGTNDARQPFFSPDAEWVGFFAGGQLQRVSVTGGAPITITPLPPGETRGASWGADNTILFAAGPSLYRVPMAGGDPVPLELTQVEQRGRAGADSTANSGGQPRWPHHLPDGEHALVSVVGGTGVLDLGTGEVRFLLDGTQASYVPTGHLLFHAGEERIRAVPFDIDRLEIVGAEVPVLEGVFVGPGGSASAFAVSETGTLAYVTGGFERSLWLVERDGREERVPVDPRGYRWPRFSPDGNRVAVIVDPRPSDVWMVDLQRGSAKRLTTSGHHVNPTWAPDGERLGFSLVGDLHWMRWREGGEPQLTSARPLPQYQPSWSIDDHIMVNEIHPENGSDLAVINLVDGSSASFLATPASESAPNFSPDGRWVAYYSDVSGTREVYLRPFPGLGPRHSVSVGGGVEPRWSMDGREIFYRDGNRILAVEVSTSPTFSSGPPQELFDASAYDFSQFINWDVGPDGRFVMVKSDPSRLRQVHVVQNFFEELRQVVPDN